MKNLPPLNQRPARYARQPDGKKYAEWLLTIAIGGAIIVVAKVLVAAGIVGILSL